MRAGFLDIAFFGLTVEASAEAAAAESSLNFLTTFSGLLSQLGLALGPFIRIVLTALEAGGIFYLARCQWSSWAWRIECEFLCQIDESYFISLP